MSHEGGRMDAIGRRKFPEAAISFPEPLQAPRHPGSGFPALNQAQVERGHVKQ